MFTDADLKKVKKNSVWFEVHNEGKTEPWKEPVLPTQNPRARKEFDEKVILSIV